MLYTKPAVKLIGKAINAVKGGTKDDNMNDNPKTATIPAYEADE